MPRSRPSEPREDGSLALIEPTVEVGVGTDPRTLGRVDEDGGPGHG